MAFLYETHLHTSQASACAVNTGSEQALAYAERGYAGIIVTDHFFNGNTAVPSNISWPERVELFVSGFMDAKEAGELYGLDVFLGWEYYIRGQEFLTYGLGYDFLIAHPEVERMEIKEYSKLVRDNGGFLAQAHPYRKAAYIKKSSPADAKYIDAVESFNAQNLDAYNEQARRFAAKHNLPIQAGSDSHSEKLWFASGIILQKRAKDIFDIIDAVKNREVELLTPQGNIYLQ